MYSSKEIASNCKEYEPYALIRNSLTDFNFNMGRPYVGYLILLLPHNEELMNDSITLLFEATIKDELDGKTRTLSYQL